MAGRRIRQIRHRPDSGEQFLVEVSGGKLEKATGPLGLEPTPTPERVLEVLGGDFAPDPRALTSVRDAPAPARADYELNERGQVLDVRKSAPTPIATVDDRRPAARDTPPDGPADS